MEPTLLTILFQGRLRDLLSQREAWCVGQSWMRNLPLGIRHHRPTCPTRSGNRDNRPNTRLFFATRVSVLLHGRKRLRVRYDIQSRAEIWEVESVDIHLDLQHRWINLYHGDQGVRHRGEVDYWGQQPVHASVDICFHDCCSCVYSNADELFQQGAKPVRHKPVSSFQ